MLALIREYPQVGQQLSGGLCRVVVPEFPYVIVYRPLAAIVRVVACAHTSRREGYWRGRLEDPTGEHEEPDRQPAP